MFDAEDLQVFGAWLRRKRISVRLTQAEAAKLAGVSRVLWSQMERGKSRPRRATVERIALAVNGRVARALALLSYPEAVVQRARRESKSASVRLDKAERAFRDVLLHVKEYPEVAFDLMLVYRNYHRERLERAFAAAPRLYDYEPVVERVSTLPYYYQWRLAKKIVLHLWETEQLFLLPELPEHKEINREQSRMLKILAMNIKELRMEKAIREQAKLRKK